jgi:hypothetical protein
MSSCTVSSSFRDPAFFPDAFHNTRAIEFVRRMTFRYGHTSDIVLLATGSEEQQKDYLKGLLASSITIFCFFLVWVCILLICKRIGPSKAGWLSGRRDPLPPRPHVMKESDLTLKEHSERASSENEGSSRILDSNELREEAPQDGQDVQEDSGPKEAEDDNLRVRPSTKTAKSEDGTVDDSDWNLWNQQHISLQRQERVKKVIVFIAALLIIISCIVMTSKG